MPAKKRISSKPISQGFSTVKKASITANIQYTRGKELVEEDPFKLIPDPENPRPGEIIDDEWLKKNLKVGENESLCHSVSKDWFIPKFSDLKGDLGGAKEEDYEFLSNLAQSIRREGLIEPIEIYLTDNNQDPSYFQGKEVDHGYVILEGHQRRLAAMMAGLDRITCIKITDDALIAKIRLKNRKLRRQLSENNLRKNITAGQHYQIVRKLFDEQKGSEDIPAEELKNILGLNIKSAETLKRIVTAPAGRYPKELFDKLINGSISMRLLRDLSSKSSDEIVSALNSSTSSPPPIKETKVEKVKRGTSGGRVKKSATFKIQSSQDSLMLSKYLQKVIPELQVDQAEPSAFKQVEYMLKQLLERAKKETS
jgi:ParB-like chromosome segregation protein Spo0J